MKAHNRKKMIGGAVLTDREAPAWVLSAMHGEVCKILRYRFGDVIDWTDDGDLWMVPLASTVVAAHIEKGRPLQLDALARYLLEWSPDAPDETVQSIAASAIKNRRFFTAADLGDAFALTKDERERLQIRFIRFKGGRGNAWLDYLRERDRRRKEQKRRLNGKKSRAEYLAAARSTSALAIRFGVTSRTIRTWLAAGWNPSSETAFPGSVRTIGNIIRNNPGSESVSRIAASLGMSRATLYRKASGSGLSVAEYVAMAQGQRPTKAASGPKSGSLQRVKRVAPKAQEKKKPADRSTTIHRHNNFHDQVITKIRGFSEALNSAPFAVRLVVSNAAKAASHHGGLAARERGQRVSRRALA